MGDLLAPTLFSRLLIKIQLEELRRANIPNFEQCKYCTFGTSMMRVLENTVIYNDAFFPSFLSLSFCPVNFLNYGIAHKKTRTILNIFHLLLTYRKRNIIS